MLFCPLHLLLIWPGASVALVLLPEPSLHLLLFSTTSHCFVFFLSFYVYMCCSFYFWLSCCNAGSLSHFFVHFQWKLLGFSLFTYLLFQQAILSTLCNKHRLYVFLFQKCIMYVEYGSKQNWHPRKILIVGFIVSSVGKNQIMKIKK